MNENVKKNKFYTKWWFWLIIVIIVIVAVGSSSNTSKPTTTLTSGTNENATLQTNNSTTATNKEYVVGEVYQDNSIAIKFVSLDDNFKGYNQYVDVKDGCRVIKAEFEFENIGSSDNSVSTYDFNCYADGYDCEAFWGTDDSIFTSNLSVGKKAKGNVYFQVPTNATNITLEYGLNIFTSSKVIFKVK